ncbi:MAG: hypothetical protein RR061_08030 [Muribaculaceae bacterium]
MDFSEIIIYIIVISVILISSFAKKKIPQKGTFEKSVSPITQEDLSQNEPEKGLPPVKLNGRFNHATSDSEYNKEVGTSFEPISSLEEYEYGDSHPDLPISADWRKAIITAEILKTKF